MKYFVALALLFAGCSLFIGYSNKHWRNPAAPSVHAPTIAYTYTDSFNVEPMAWWKTFKYDWPRWGVVRNPVTSKVGQCIVVPLGVNPRGSNVALLTEGFFTCYPAETRHTLVAK